MRDPVVYDVQTDLGIPCSEHSVPAVLGELLKHLQYARGQCQAPVDRVVAAYNVRGVEFVGDARPEAASAWHHAAHAVCTPMRAVPPPAAVAPHGLETSHGVSAPQAAVADIEQSKRKRVPTSMRRAGKVRRAVARCLDGVTGCRWRHNP